MNTEQRLNLPRKVFEFRILSYLRETTVNNNQNPVTALSKTMSPRNALPFSTQINSSTASQVQYTSSESGNEEELQTMSATRDIEVFLFDI